MALVKDYVDFLSENFGFTPSEYLFETRTQKVSGYDFLQEDLYHMDTSCQELKTPIVDHIFFCEYRGILIIEKMLPFRTEHSESALALFANRQNQKQNYVFYYYDQPANRYCARLVTSANTDVDGIFNSLQALELCIVHDFKQLEE